MKKFRIYAVIGFLAIATVSCQKEIDDAGLLDPVVNPVNNDSLGYKVKTYTESFTSTLTGTISATFNLTYDGSDRIVSLVDSADSTLRIIYSYPTPASFEMDQYSGDTITLHETAYLNSNLLIDSSLQYEITGDTTTEKYSYNGAGSILQIKEYDYTTSGGSQLTEQADYVTGNGNILQETENSGTVTTYEYSADTNTVYVGLKYISKNKNLVTKTTIVDGTTTITINHTYTFDSSHRITSERQEYSTGELAEKRYTY